MIRRSSPWGNTFCNRRRVSLYRLEPTVAGCPWWRGQPRCWEIRRFSKHGVTLPLRIARLVAKVVGEFGGKVLIESDFNTMSFSMAGAVVVGSVLGGRYPS